MPLIRNAFSKPASSRRSRGLPPVSGTTTSAGVSITPERAMQVSTVYSCIRVLAESVAGLPVSLNKREAGRRIRQDSHPMSRLISYEPNPNMDSGELWRSVIGWMGTRGNGLVFIERNRAGQPIHLWPISPISTDLRLITSGSQKGQIAYKVDTDVLNEYVPLPANGIVLPGDMMHFRAFGLGLVGLSPISLARQQIGTAFAAGEYIAGFFARDASPGGTITVPGTLTDEQFNRLQAQWREAHEGVGNSHALGILEGGAQWDTVSLSPADASFLEVMKFGRTEIAAMYGVPPHKVGDLDRATFSNIEQQSLDFVIYGLMPYLSRLERVIQRAIGDPTYYVRFDPKGLLRGDIETRYKAYAQARQWGWASANDIRRDEDEDPIENGDIYLEPVNMLPAGDPRPGTQG